MSEMKKDRSEYMREYYRKNKERCDQNLKTYRDANWERVLENARKSKRKNAEKNRITNAQYRERHPELYAEATKRWARKNPEVVRILRHVRRTRVSGDRLSRDIITRLRRLQRGKCACCRLPLKSDFHVDHIVPLARGGRNIDENVQLLHSKCNLRKMRRIRSNLCSRRGT